MARRQRALSGALTVTLEVLLRNRTRPRGSLQR
jgi:hypothetical protein